MICLGLGNALLSLVVSPPTNDRSSLILVPLNVFLASLDVSNVGSASDAGNGSDANDRVSGDITQPDRLVVDLVDNFTREVAATCDTVRINERDKKM